MALLTGGCVTQAGDKTKPRAVAKQATDTGTSHSDSSRDSSMLVGIPHSVAVTSSQPQTTTSKMRKRIRAKYDRMTLMSYARLRELRHSAKLSSSASVNGKKWKLNLDSSSKVDTLGEAGVGSCCTEEEQVKEQQCKEHHTEMVVSKDAEDAAETLQQRVAMETSPPPQKTNTDPETPDVTSSCTENEARVIHVAEMLGIPTDPQTWNGGQVQTWLNGMLQEFYSCHLSNLTVDGALLCLLSPQQITQRLPDFTTFLLDQLQTWKQECGSTFEERNHVSSTRNGSPVPNHESAIDSGDDNGESSKHRHSNGWHQQEQNNNKVTEDESHCLSDAANGCEKNNDAAESRVENELIVHRNGSSGVVSGEQCANKGKKRSLESDEELTETDSHRLFVLEEVDQAEEKKYIANACSTVDQIETSSSSTSSSNCLSSIIDLSSHVKVVNQHGTSLNGVGPSESKRRKSETTNERLKGFSKKLRLKIETPTSPNKVESGDDKKAMPFKSYENETQSAPVLKDAFNKGYQDAVKLRDWIKSTKLSGVPVGFIQSPTILATPPASGNTGVPKIELSRPPLYSPLTPFTPDLKHPLTPKTPLSPPPLTPIIQTYNKNRSPQTSPLAAPVLIKQEPQSPPVQPASQTQSTNFLTVPTPVFRTPSPRRSPKTSPAMPSPHHSNNAAPWTYQAQQNSPSIYHQQQHQHDPDTPLDLSTESKKLGSKPTVLPASSSSPLLKMSSPSPSALLPMHSLLTRSFSMPDAAPPRTPSSSSALAHHHHLALGGGGSTLTPSSSSSAAAAMMIHPLAMSGSSFIRQFSQDHPHSMANGYTSSVEGDSSDPSEVDTPSINKVGGNGSPMFSPTPSYNRLGRVKLWEFLLELLWDGTQNCIEWISQQQGIFKILNSEQVASLWGQRKGLSSMNYDKLSRSIRQYYKQGIIKKTQDSKRLVYQFDCKLIDMHNTKTAFLKFDTRKSAKMGEIA